MTAAQAGRIERRHGKRPAPKPAVPLEIGAPTPSKMKARAAIAAPALLHDPRERLLCAQLAKFRRLVRLYPEDFGRAIGSSAGRIETREMQRASWPEDALRDALPKLGELLTVMQGDLEEAAGLLAEITEEIGVRA